MDKLVDYVKYYDNVLSGDVCDALIHAFDRYSPSTNPWYKNSEQSWAQDYRSFVEAQITQIPEFKSMVNHVYSVANGVYNSYKAEIGEFFPTSVGFEDLRMKRYMPNDYDQFGWHTDVGNYASARRFLVMFFYLNDVESGGETQFAFNGIDAKVHCTIKPKRGRIVVFPPMWMYPHRGCKPISGSKYILSTYAHYQ